MKKLFLFAFCAALLTATAAADTIVLTISDGTNTTTVSSVTNSVTFTGSVGNFTIDFTAGTGNQPGSSFGKVSVTNNTVTNTGNSAGTLTFTLTGFDFANPVAPGTSPNMVLSSAGSYDWSAGISSGTSVSFQGFADPTNLGSLANATAVCSISGPGTAGACPATTSYWTRGSGFYSLTEITTINLAAGDTIDTTGSVTTTAVPEPASLALLGSGLLAGGGFIRRNLLKR